MEFKKGDKPAPGITILAVIKGDAKDSFSHYVYRKHTLDGKITEFKSKEHINGQIYETVLGKQYAVPVEEVCIVGNPDAACIHFKVEGELRNRVLKPDEFEKFLADYKPKEDKGALIVDNSPLLAEIDEMPAEYYELLEPAGYKTVQNIVSAGVDKLVEIKGIGEKRAAEIIEICEGALINESD